ncbi:MAG: hypothetical protein HY553_02080 [Elusimicrobia bacterium]|nr:hypothetical protein [Elusimicrobiota bacterium]
MRNLPALAFLLLPVLALPLRAADPDDDLADGPRSQWTPPPATPPGPAVPSGTSESEYGAPDRRRQDEERRRGVLDQLCRHLRLDKDFNFGGEQNMPGAAIGVERRMEADFDNSLVLLDEETLRFSWNLGKSEPIGGDGDSASVYLSAATDGRSFVARRLGTFDSCSEVRRLIDVTDVKIVVPFVPEHLRGVEKVIVPVTADSIAAMGQGELWRIPLTVNLGYGASAADADPDTVISIGFGKGKHGTSSMTLWRLSEKQARFRFRIDFVQVKSRSAGFSQTFSPIEFNTDGANILSKFLKREVARQLHKYTSAYIGVHGAKSDGRRLILEYMIDPTDPQQGSALAEAMRGNFWTLLRYARKVQTEFTTREDILEAYGKLQAINAELLGEPNYAARSDYAGNSRTWPLNLPFIVNRTLSENLASDTVTQFTGDGGSYEFHSANRTPNAEYFRMPFVGPLVKDLESRNVDVIAYAPAGKPYGDPMAVYLHNQGFLRLPVSAIGEAVEDANSILRLAGTARPAGGDPTMELPVGRFMPPSQRVPDGNAPAGYTEQADQKGWLSFTLVMNQKALRDALSVTSAEVVKAFARSVPVADRTWAEWLAAHGTLKDGRLEYDALKAREELGITHESGGADWLAKLSREAGGLASDIAAASVAALTPEARARALAKALSYRNSSGLKQADVLRVLVQFMDPLDLTGDFVSASVGTTKRALKVEAHYQLVKGRPGEPLLKGAGEARARFGDGSRLTDGN